MKRQSNYIYRGRIMEKNVSDLISLIRLLFLDEDIELEDCNFEEVYKIAKFHSLQTIFYYALMKYREKRRGVNTPSDFLKEVTKDYKTNLSKVACQDAEKELLLEEFEIKKIKYMLLKGSVIRKLYPSPEMRSMADIDIYVDDTKMKEIKSIMSYFGYECKSFLKGNHDTYMKVPFMNVEMHRDLMNESFEYSKYYKNFWSRLIKDEKKEYEFHFSKEDFYIYMIAHSAKHFSNGGFGIRNVLDEFVYLNKYKEVLDFAYIDDELNKLGLKKFETNLYKLSLYYFSSENIGEEYMDSINAMSNYVIKSGTYGTIDHSVLKSLVGEKGIENINSTRIKYFFKRLFPPLKIMEKRNPSLKKWKVLLPWFYFTRILKFIFLKNKKIDKEIEAAKNVKVEEIEENKKMHDDIGA